MSTSVAAIIQSKAVETTETKQYTSTNLRTIIDNYDVYNGSAGALTYTVKLVPSGGTAGASNTLFSRSVAANETVRGVLAGQILEPGDFISTLSSGAGLVHRASGRTVTL